MDINCVPVSPEEFTEIVSAVMVMGWIQVACCIFIGFVIGQYFNYLNIRSDVLDILESRIKAE